MPTGRMRGFPRRPPGPPCLAFPSRPSAAARRTRPRLRAQRTAGVRPAGFRGRCRRSAARAGRQRRGQDDAAARAGRIAARRRGRRRTSTAGRRRPRCARARSPTWATCPALKADLTRAGKPRFPLRPAWPRGAASCPATRWRSSGLAGYEDTLGAAAVRRARRSACRWRACGWRPRRCGCSTSPTPTSTWTASTWSTAWCRRTCAMAARRC